MHKATRVLAVLAAAGLAQGFGASARAADGAALFHKYCSVCHDTEPGKNKLGPSLADVVGRKAGSLPDYNYSAGMKSSGITWNDKTLDTYLTSPRTLVPNAKMMFIGVKNPDERHAIIAYLATLKD